MLYQVDLNKGLKDSPVNLLRMSMCEYTLLLDESFLWFECWQAA